MISRSLTRASTYTVEYINARIKDENPNLKRKSMNRSYCDISDCLLAPFSSHKKCSSNITYIIIIAPCRNFPCYTLYRSITSVYMYIHIYVQTFASKSARVHVSPSEINEFS
ncbi:hypothetical protein PUN28_011807 [Cardiocondyla obscurior]|uniref:Uncharacterized protein n=1 Tax=Cardiocondyla obscurior TaxID=286306 RepID=A0AAW2FJD0_9HYME